MSNHMVSEEKTKSTLMSLQDITLLLYFVITGRIDLISTTSSLRSLRIELDNRRLNLNLTKSNWYNGADLMLLSKEEVLSLKQFLSTLFLGQHTKTVKKMVNYYKSNKQSLMALTLDLTFFLINAEILICSAILTLKCHIHSQ